MKKQLLIFSMILMAGGLLAQEVAKRVVVEHFTNSRCGICANRNPGFYQNLEAHPDVIHISIHPSRPYSSCLLHQHNSSENDARTNYYGILGSTPRLVIQGTPISVSTNYGDASIFTDVANETTPVSITLYQVKENDQLQVDVVIKAEADNNIGTANLFLAAAEKLVNYNAPNGESEHHDVFRRTFTDNPQGLAVAIPAIAGEQLVARYTVAADEAWVFDQMFVVAILNDATDRKVIQAAATDPSDNSPLSSTQDLQPLDVQFFPNPVHDHLEVRLPGNLSTAQAQLVDVTGRIVLQTPVRTGEPINLAQLPAGSYWLKIRTENMTAVRQIVKE
ncbi:MAG: T9SS C-terminal target domain-containing protein [Bacteroidetes bacterium]|nr:MAG: T9SS C-terminal target domain-containing protein [Bacteroidota bacterium]